MKKFFARLYLGLILLLLYAPLIFIAVSSFTESKVLGNWTGFSTKLYSNLFTGGMQGSGLMNAVYNTLIIALIAALVSTILGTLAAIGLFHSHGKGKNAVMFLNNIPMVNPDVITGVSLFLLFVFLGVTQGYVSVVLAHITFCTPYVVLNVLPKLHQMNPKTYEAALDLGATPSQALRKVLIPQLMPGMITGFILAFTMSLDDFAVTFFTRGTVGLETLSTFIYTDARKGGLTPELRPLMTIIFIVVFALLVVINIRQERAAKKKSFFKVMKRLFSFAALAVMLLVAGCKTDRSTVLKVYNWSDYIDEDVIEEFETWYQEQTGETVKVIYQTFDINETMLSKIERGKEDFDVVCPSDYIIERMLKSDLLLPLDRNFGDTPNYIDANLSPYIRAQFDKIDGGDKNANDYAVGYMWGTTGILYNAKYVTDEEASTWDILCNEKFRDKIFVKDSPRDVYSQIILFLHQKDIEEGRVTMDQLMNYTNDEDIAAVETYMKRAKELVAGWEADFGKDQMTQELGYVNLTWSGDGVWAIKEGKEVGVDLRYVCPKEGFTVWFDGWVIPKYAQNVKAANYWINFMSRPDIVIRNVDATGYVSVSGAPEVMDEFIEEDLEPIDVSYFFGPEATAVRLDPVLYPDKETIARSTMEHDWGEHTADLVSMWSRVKGNTMNISTVIILAVAAIAVILLLVSRMRKASHKTNKYSGKNARRRR